MRSTSATPTVFGVRGSEADEVPEPASRLPKPASRPASKLLDTAFGLEGSRLRGSDSIMLVGSTFDDAAVCCAVRCALAVLCSPPCQATAEKARPSANSSTACSAHLPLPAHVALPCAALTRPAPAHPLQAEVPVEVIVILPSLALDFLLSDGWPAIPPILASELHISLVALPASYPLVTIVPVFTTTTTTAIVATASLRHSVLDAARSSRLVTEYQRIIPTPPSNHSTVALSPSWFSEAFASDSHADPLVCPSHPPLLPSPLACCDDGDMAVTHSRGAAYNVRNCWASFGLFCIHVGEFLTFAAVILMVFANIGQLTNNIVTRNIRYVSVDASNLGNALASTNTATNDLYAANPAAPVAQGNGIRQSYQWGLYNYCAGQPSGDSRACSDKSFGFEWQPVDALLNDAPQDARNGIQNFLPEATFRDSKYLGDYSKPAMYLIFIGSCLALLSWISGLLSHRFAFLGAAFIALLAALTLGVGAALLTAIYTKARDSVGVQYGVVVHYGNALWMTWGAFVACVLAIVPYILSCCTGRSDDY
ncbi:uncharacterized protein PAN0_001c0510 [Moesziomyces antarcticus]|uniref:uncharacterized protein n=1 Tax=Pseudozyma antarctica TaxID=84753 RepID=UPI00071987BA|nr:uncharacterized protein PAN0_001c0510 [Moesziomyces antarcticus]GAK62310.1 conserved hypothetical protein [Moesziomyces antarcticus]